MANLKRRTRTRGLAAVEAAIVLPLIVLVIMAVFEYGWMFIKSQQIAGAAREGARAGAKNGATSADADAAAEAIFAQVGLTSAHSISVSMGANPGEPVTVIVTLTYAGDAALTNFPLLPVPPTLVRTHTFAKEGPLPGSAP